MGLLDKLFGKKNWENCNPDKLASQILDFGQYEDARIAINIKTRVTYDEGVAGNEYSLSVIIKPSNDVVLERGEFVITTFIAGPWIDYIESMIKQKREKSEQEWRLREPIRRAEERERRRQEEEKLKRIRDW